MQITEKFTLMIELLEQLITLTQGLVAIIFLHFLVSLAVAKNTRPEKKIRPSKDSLFSRLWQRLRPRKRLPEGETKELVT